MKNLENKLKKKWRTLKSVSLMGIFSFPILKLFDERFPNELSIPFLVTILVFIIICLIGLSFTIYIPNIVAKAPKLREKYYE